MDFQLRSYLMVTYRSLSAHGRVHYSYFNTLNEALRQAAQDHNYGKIVDEIVDNNRRYNRQEVINLCDRMGLLR